VTIGPNTHLGKGVRVAHTIVCEGVHIKSHAYVHTHTHTHTHARTYTIVCEGVHIKSHAYVSLARTLSLSLTHAMSIPPYLLTHSSLSLLSLSLSPLPPFVSLWLCLCLSLYVCVSVSCCVCVCVCVCVCGYIAWLVCFRLDTLIGKWLTHTHTQHTDTWPGVCLVGTQLSGNGSLTLSLSHTHTQHAGMWPGVC